MFECPSFFPIGDRWVLIISPMRGRSNYFTGKFSDYRFEPERYEELDPGGCLYAPQVFRDDDGRWIMFGWLKENRLLAARHGWQGVQSLPRVLSLDENKSLNFAPCEEVESLRGDKKEFRDLSVKSGDSDLLADLTGDCLDITCQVDMKSAGGFGLAVRRSPDGREQTRIVFDRVSQTLSVDRSRSSISILPRKTARTTAFKLGESEPLELRVLLDRSVIEVFANRRACLTSRIYPKRPDSLGLGLFADGGEAGVNSLDVWQIAPVWQ
jgi:beta-fructofuranosidase